MREPVKRALEVLVEVRPLAHRSHIFCIVGSICLSVLDWKVATAWPWPFVNLLISLISKLWEVVHLPGGWVRAMVEVGIGKCEVMF